jgi:hypothetical protein
VAFGRFEAIRGAVNDFTAPANRRAYADHRLGSAASARWPDLEGIMEPRAIGTLRSEIVRSGLWQGPARALAALATRLLVRDEPGHRGPRHGEPQESVPAGLPVLDLPPAESEAARPVERPPLLQPLVERCEPFPGQARVDYFVMELATTRPPRLH